MLAAQSILFKVLPPRARVLSSNLVVANHRHLAIQSSPSTIIALRGSSRHMRRDELESLNMVSGVKALFTRWSISLVAAKSKSGLFQSREKLCGPARSKDVAEGFLQIVFPCSPQKGPTDLPAGPEVLSGCSWCRSCRGGSRRNRWIYHARSARLPCRRARGRVARGGGRIVNSASIVVAPRAEWRKSACDHYCRDNGSNGPCANSAAAIIKTIRSFSVVRVLSPARLSRPG